MKSRLLGAVCACATALVLSTSVNAAIVTQGYLTSDDTTNIINDSLNNVEYLRLDVLAGLNYAQTLAVLSTQDGGGWQIATPSVALGFATALLGGSATCAHDGTDVTIAVCGYEPDWVDGIFGDNSNQSLDYAWFLDDNGEADAIGIINIEGGSAYNDGRVNLYDSTLAYSDQYSSSGDNYAEPVPWLVSRSATVVPVPAAVWLFGSGLLGLIGVARRKVST